MWPTENGALYLRARYYDPSTAHFISRDPATATTRQPYQYVADSPLNHTDPNGLWWFGTTGSASGFFGLLAGIAQTTGMGSRYGYVGGSPVNGVDSTGLYGPPDEGGDAGPPSNGDPSGIADRIWSGCNRLIEQARSSAEEAASAARRAAEAARLAVQEFGAAIKSRLEVDALLGDSGPIFGRNKLGVLNRNDVVRIGWGWKGPAQGGHEVFRIAIGNPRAPIHFHIDLF